MSKRQLVLFNDFKKIKKQKISDMVLPEELVMRILFDYLQLYKISDFPLGKRFDLKVTNLFYINKSINIKFTRLIHEIINTKTEFALKNTVTKRLNGFAYERVLGSKINSLAHKLRLISSDRCAFCGKSCVKSSDKVILSLKVASVYRNNSSCISICLCKICNSLGKTTHDINDINEIYSESIQSSIKKLFRYTSKSKPIIYRNVFVYDTIVNLLFPDCNTSCRFSSFLMKYMEELLLDNSCRHFTQNKEIMRNIINLYFYNYNDNNLYTNTINMVFSHIYSLLIRYYITQPKSPYINIYEGYHDPVCCITNNLDYSINIGEKLSNNNILKIKFIAEIINKYEINYEDFKNYYCEASKILDPIKPYISNSTQMFLEEIIRKELNNFLKQYFTNKCHVIDGEWKKQSELLNPLILFNYCFMNYDQSKDFLDLFLYNTFENIKHRFVQIIPYLKIYNMIKKNNKFSKQEKIIGNSIINCVYSYCLYNENNLYNLHVRKQSNKTIEYINKFIKSLEVLKKDISYIPFINYICSITNNSKKSLLLLTKKNYYLEVFEKNYILLLINMINQKYKTDRYLQYFTKNILEINQLSLYKHNPIIKIGILSIDEKYKIIKRELLSSDEKYKIDVEMCRYKNLSNSVISKLKTTKLMHIAQYLINYINEHHPTNKFEDLPERIVDVDEYNRWYKENFVLISE